jgi:hypothetical protein
VNLMVCQVLEPLAECDGLVHGLSAVITIWILVAVVSITKTLTIFTL